MKQRLTILGATGSIGASTLDIVRQHSERFEVVALTAQDNAKKLIALARQFRPQHVAIGNAQHYPMVKDALSPLGIHVCTDLVEAASIPVDISMCAIVGAAGLAPTLAAAAHAKRVALANKESMVCAGPLVLATCTHHQTTLLPVDSEHNAVFQVLTTEHRAQLEKVTLTASGGPFLQRPLDSMAAVTPQEAIAHPRWSMGAKISVDSASMMNKGLELIEAHYLFALPPQQLSVLIHPQSIVHSLVHYADGSVLAQLGMPDMRIPIGYTLGWPQRLSLDTPRLDLAGLGTLAFHAVEAKRFPCLQLACEAMQAGPAAMIALNAANEVAVAAFLAGRFLFTDIASTVARVLAKTENTPISSLADVMAADALARRRANETQGVAA